LVARHLGRLWASGSPPLGVTHGLQPQRFQTSISPILDASRVINTWADVLNLPVWAWK